jgi:acid phosphatase class B
MNIKRAFGEEEDLLKHSSKWKSVCNQMVRKTQMRSVALEIIEKFPKKYDVCVFVSPEDAKKHPETRKNMRAFYETICSEIWKKYHLHLRITRYKIEILMGGGEALTFTLDWDK